MRDEQQVKSGEEGGGEGGGTGEKGEKRRMEKELMEKEEMKDLVSSPNFLIDSSSMVTR